MGARSVFRIPPLEDSLLTGAVHLSDLFRAKLFINNGKLFESLTQAKQFACSLPLKKIAPLRGLIFYERKGRDSNPRGLLKALPL